MADCVHLIGIVAFEEDFVGDLSCEDSSGNIETQVEIWGDVSCLSLQGQFETSVDFCGVLCRCSQ